MNQDQIKDQIKDQSIKVSTTATYPNKKDFELHDLKATSIKGGA
ncbi:hypothetical protein LINGRAHAP2_LOCUS16362 [Linum grandiflorum]